MRALVKRPDGPGLSLEDVPVPEVGPGDVLVRVIKTGICGTDLHIASWDDWAREHVRVPLVVGHEFVGRVAEVGRDVTHLKPGDLVSGEGHIVCGRCRNCMAGRRVQCAFTESVGVTRDGAFADYVAVPGGNLWRHAEGIDLDVASVFDPFGNAVHTATVFPLVGEDVLITGAGPIGLMAAIVARHVGARYVVVSDISPFRLALAKSIGVTRAVDARSEKLADVVAELGMSEGFDVGLEMSGHGEALRSMLSVTCHGGRIAMLGLPSDPFELDFSQLVMNMVTLKGIYGRQMFETWYEMTVFTQSGVDISPVITHRLPAESFDEGFSIVASGECGKVILNWWDGGSA